MAPNPAADHPGHGAAPASSHQHVRENTTNTTNTHHRNSSSDLAHSASSLPQPARNDSLAAPSASPGTSSTAPKQASQSSPKRGTAQSRTTQRQRDHPKNPQTKPPDRPSRPKTTSTASLFATIGQPAMATSNATNPDANPTTEPIPNIHALNDLKAEVPALMQSAGLALNALTGNDLRPTPADEAAGRDPAPQSNDLDARKANFQAHAQGFYSGVKALSEGMNRSLAGLVEAGIVKDTVGEEGEGKGSNGGQGEMETGWLNARAKDVGVGKAHELVRDVRRVLEERKKRREEDWAREQAEDGDGESGGDRMEE